MVVSQTSGLMNKQLPVYFIFITTVLDSMGIGIIMPVMPDLIQEVGQYDLSDAAKWGGWLTVVFAINQFLFAPTLGGLSDAYGRRPVLLISLLVMTCLLYTSPSPRDQRGSRMPSSA